MSRSTPLSSFEHLYRFESPSLRAYLIGDSEGQAPAPMKLNIASKRMTQESTHPLSLYAAGCAAAEAAMWRSVDKKGRVPLDVRTKSLERARSLWATSIEGFAEAHAKPAGPVAAAWSLGFQLRGLHALAAMPLMEVITQWQGKADVTDRAYYGAVRNTKNHILQLGSVVQGIEVQTDHEALQKRTAAERLVGNVLLQAEAPAPFAIIPAMMRHDVDQTPGKSAALTAVSAALHHRKRHVQILQDPHEPTTPSRYPLIADFDFTVGDTHHTPLDMLGVLTGAPEYELQTGIERRSQQLIGRLSAFDAWRAIYPTRPFVS